LDGSGYVRTGRMRVLHVWDAWGSVCRWGSEAIHVAT